MYGSDAPDAAWGWPLRRHAKAPSGSRAGSGSMMESGPTKRRIRVRGGGAGGRLRLIASIHDPAVIREILAHLGLSHSGQSPGPAPPEPSAAAP